eukprot:3712032-Rhodomonas_salina.2
MRLRHRHRRRRRQRQRRRHTDTEHARRTHTFHGAAAANNNKTEKLQLTRACARSHLRHARRAGSDGPRRTPRPQRPPGSERNPRVAGAGRARR